MVVANFSKYQGTGNDFIMIDDRNGVYGDTLDEAQIAKLCHRRFGIGADGLMLLQQSEISDFKMDYYNADGHPSSMCGNGGRCIVAFAHRLGVIKDRCTFEAVDGIHEATIESDVVELKMGRPYGYRQIKSGHSWIHTGSPHYVQFHDKSLEDFPVFEKGRAIRHHSDFAKDDGTNANFVHVQGDHQLMVRTFERGVEDETYSCGTGVTACAYIYLLEQQNGQSNRVNIETLGGKLSVSIENMGEDNEHVFLVGPATFVFDGEIVVKSSAFEKK